MSSDKKILFLGASPAQLSAIELALELGYYVITTDYLSNNPGHRLANESYLISTTDKKEILKLSEKLKIDAIIAYASDPAAPTASFVSEKLGLPGNPHKSVEILANKRLFRKFLKKNNFNVPRFNTFTDFESGYNWLKSIDFPIYIKPVDSSGSKGVTRINSISQFSDAFNNAISFSRSNQVIIEEEIIKSGSQIAGDGFIVNGELRFYCWADEHFDSDCNGLVPIGQTFPTLLDEKLKKIAYNETNRLIKLLKMKNGPVNFDFVFDKNNEFYFLELGPRNGGCLIPEVINYCTGIDLIKYTLDAALGNKIEQLEMKPTQGFWSSYMIHALKNGNFKGLKISNKLKEHIIEKDLWVKKGDPVKRYFGSHHTLGTMILRYKNSNEMNKFIEKMNNYIEVKLM